MNGTREYSPKRFAVSSVECPSCDARLDRDAKWCESCGFTGAKSIEMFGENPPPLIPILDVVDLWNPAQQKSIETAIARFKKRFPQIHWSICAVSLEPEVSLPLFGFWMMNVCPLNPNETAADREWTVLLLLNSATGKASITTGYSVEVWLSDEKWEEALAAMPDFARGRSDQAVVAFLRSAGVHFEQAWKRSRTQLLSPSER